MQSVNTTSGHTANAHRIHQHVRLGKKCGDVEDATVQDYPRIVGRIVHAHLVGQVDAIRRRVLANHALMLGLQLIARLVVVVHRSDCWCNTLVQLCGSRINAPNY